MLRTMCDENNRCLSGENQYIVIALNGCCNEVAVLNIIASISAGK